uniref:Immunoglobulin domain-containing protein n=1 Tax=Bos taurus TaxID=9913 RepID=A0AAA9RXL8_BOVIN
SGSPLLLPVGLLSLPPLGHRAQRNSQQHHEMKQPRDLSAPEGGSILIPFSFSHPWELAKDPNMRISWRWKHYHGEFIYNMTPLFTHKNFKNRLILNWAEPEKNGSLWISNLRREDESVYFCRVQLDTLRDGKKEWQSIEGTKLTITPREVWLLPFVLSPVWSLSCPMSVPPAMSSAHTHSRCRGAPCPITFSHLPFLLCSEPQNISSTILPSVYLSSLSFSFSLLPSPLPPSLSYHHPPMWFQSPCPCVHPDRAPLSWS